MRRQRRPLHHLGQVLVEEDAGDELLAGADLELLEEALDVVADGVGVTLLPEFSVLEDPLVRSGLVTWRPLAAPVPSVSLAALRPASRPFRSEASLVLWDALLSRAANLDRDAETASPDYESVLDSAAR